ncbi:hypothetical protein COCMIDRAFT_110646 [Bipolaris oryzae ATCC 44560]|uniref:Uncharacterized protein n=1 Tax=Bipolaris oryzae ATCC 44560 TaxID=930090 RepID=W6YW65_COCMI|nr:uncharacterized protein COCMIDRAFT_110646 [Bipolaris oryzae ATCC 44560]EUC39769.1 hypothetical protein COCMIDRAFT_110646 [Bipolaris oryzae ATCC 44560]
MSQLWYCKFRIHSDDREPLEPDRIRAIRVVLHDVECIVLVYFNDEPPAATSFRVQSKIRSPCEFTL